MDRLRIVLVLSVALVLAFGVIAPNPVGEPLAWGAFPVRLTGES